MCLSVCVCARLKISCIMLLLLQVVSCTSRCSAVGRLVAKASLTIKLVIVCELVETALSERPNEGSRRTRSRVRSGSLSPSSTVGLIKFLSLSLFSIRPTQKTRRDLARDCKQSTHTSQVIKSIIESYFCSKSNQVKSSYVKPGKKLQSAPASSARPLQ